MNQTDINNIISAIAKTGFITEFEVSNDFTNNKWMVINNRYYLDDQTSTQREIDLLAYRISTVEKFFVYTVVLVSCKKSDENSWIFLTKSINANDPNIKFLPIDTWTNIKIFTEMDHINYIQKNVSTEIQNEDSLIRDFFHLERNIFAFQEVHVGLTGLSLGNLYKIQK